MKIRDKTNIKYEKSCDNTDHNVDTYTDVKFVRLREEFNFDTCNWCVDCRKRDSDMILHDFKF